MDSTTFYAMITVYNWIEAGGFEGRDKVLALSVFMSSLMIYFLFISSVPKYRWLYCAKWKNSRQVKKNNKCETDFSFIYDIFMSKFGPDLDLIFNRYM